MKFRISSQAWKIILVMFSVGMIFFFLVAFDRSDEKKVIIEKRQALVGESIVLGSDTIEIYKYSVWHKEFILADGHRASPEMVNILLVR